MLDIEATKQALELYDDGRRLAGFEWRPVLEAARWAVQAHEKGEVLNTEVHMDASYGRLCLQVVDAGRYLVIPLDDDGSSE